jgi:phage gp37-like protein
VQIKAITDQLKEIFRDKNLTVKQWGAEEDLAAVAKNFKATPAIYVLMTGEKASPPRTGAGAHIQNLQVNFSVVMVINPSHKETASDYRNAIKAALTGWLHPDSTMNATVDYLGWRVVQYPDRLINTLDFTTRTSIRKTK